jgi:hypothetical protein
MECFLNRVNGSREIRNQQRSVHIAPSSVDAPAVLLIAAFSNVSILTTVFLFSFLSNKLVVM